MKRFNQVILKENNCFECSIYTYELLVIEQVFFYFINNKMSQFTNHFKKQLSGRIILNNIMLVKSVLNYLPEILD